jgi:hypothetical protein
MVTGIKGVCLGGEGERTGGGGVGMGGGGDCTRDCNWYGISNDRSSWLPLAPCN